MERVFVTGICHFSIQNRVQLTPGATGQSITGRGFNRGAGDSGLSNLEAGVFSAYHYAIVNIICIVNEYKIIRPLTSETVK